MCKLISILICLSTFYQVVVAQNKEIDNIHSILDEQTKYWNAGNLEQFMQGYWRNDSLVFIGKSGLTYGFEKTLANYKRNYPDLATMGILKFDIRKIEKLSKKLYFVVGKWHLTRNDKGVLEGYFSLIFKKIKGKWKIISDHSS
jgi:ketosteroid isomerase-like protein